jgi:hypothetical protein
MNLYFDNKYCYWAKPLAESIAIHEPETKIYFHTFNLSDNQIDEIKSFPNTAYIDNKKMKFDIKIADAYNKHLNRNDPLRFQITCRKGEFMLASMKKFPDEDLFIIMDVDMLMIRPLNDLKIQMKNHDVGIVRVGPGKIMGTFFAARSTKRGKQFLSIFNKQVMTDRLYLCKDQKTLDKVYTETNKNIKFLLLDRRYLDHSSNKDSYIWSAHKSAFGSKVERFKKYIEVLERMRNG